MHAHELWSQVDENENSQFDADATSGIEGFGASNDVVGPPDFVASSVKVKSDTKLAVSMTYF